MSTRQYMPAVVRNLSLPVIASPLFIVNYPELVLAQCKASIVDSFPALNAPRPAEMLDGWLSRIGDELDAYREANPNATIGPLAVNRIVHHPNSRLAQDVQTCTRRRVPIFVASLRAPPRDVIDAVHGHGAPGGRSDARYSKRRRGRFTATS